MALSGGSRGELFQDELEESVMSRNWGGEVLEGLGDLEYASKRSAESREVTRGSRETISSLIGQSSWLDRSMGELGVVDPIVFDPGEDFPTFNFSFARLTNKVNRQFC